MGLVYLLECSNEDHTTYKIGFTNISTTNRIRALQTGNSYQIKELYSYSTKYNQKLETAIQNRYSHKKRKGEWYDLDISEVSNFISNCEAIEKNFDSLKDNPFFNKDLS